MFRLSDKLARLEDRISGRWGKKLDRFFDRRKGKWKFYIPLGLFCWYFYGMLINSVHLGIKSTFNATGDPVGSIWVVNPFRNLLAVFTPTGLGVTAVGFILFCLITKKGYIWFSGYKFIRDKRGFDILPDGTHGTSGFMSKKEQEKILLTGPISELSGTLLGKLKDDPDDDDKYAEYVTLRPNSGLTEHIMVYGATGAGKTRGLVKPFILQCAAKRSTQESLICVDPKGEVYESMSSFLREQGYEVRMFNLLDMENSDAWNCLSGIEKDKDLVPRNCSRFSSGLSGPFTGCSPTSPLGIWSGALRRCPKVTRRWRPMVFSSWPTGRSGATSPLDWATACLCSKTLWWTKSPPTTRST